MSEFETFALSNPGYSLQVESCDTDHRAVVYRMGKVTGGEPIYVSRIYWDDEIERLGTAKILSYLKGEIAREETTRWLDRGTGKGEAR